MKKLLLTALAILLAVSLASCGGKGETNASGENAGNEGKNETETNGLSDQNGDTEEDGYIFDIREDDHTIIWSLDTATFVYEHDGTNVTGYTTYVDMGTKEEAEDAAALYRQLAESGEENTMKEISRKGTYLVIEYTEEAFPYTTYEEIKQISDMMKSLGS